MCFGVFVQVNVGSCHEKGKPVGYVIQENGCWDWVGAKNALGYGRLSVKRNGRSAPKKAHRVLYERWVGPIPPGLVLDHLCRNPSCVNPDHLEPVTQKENSIRGVSAAMQAYRADRCVKGHDGPWYYRPNGSQRRCKACRWEKLGTKKPRNPGNSGANERTA